MTDEPDEVIDGEAVLESDEPAPPPRKKRTPRQAAADQRKRTKRKSNLRGNTEKSAPRRVAAALRAQKGIQLRREGKTWPAIAKELRYASAGHAYESVMGHLRDNPPAVAAREALRAEMDGQIDEVLGRFLPAAILDGDAEAARVVERFLNRRARLHGLDTLPDSGLVPMDSVQGLLDLVLSLTTRFVPEAKRPAWLEAVDTATKQLAPPDR